MLVRTARGEVRAEYAHRIKFPNDVKFLEARRELNLPLTHC